MGHCNGVRGTWQMGLILQTPWGLSNLHTHTAAVTSILFPGLLPPHAHSPSLPSYRRHPPGLLFPPVTFPSMCRNTRTTSRNLMLGNAFMCLPSLELGGNSTAGTNLHLHTEQYKDYFLTSGLWWQTMHNRSRLEHNIQYIQYIRSQIVGLRSLLVQLWWHHLVGHGGSDTAEWFD